MALRTHSDITTQPLVFRRSITKTESRIIETGLQDKSSVGDLIKALLNSVYYHSSSSVFFRPRGADTLTIGQTEEWVKKKLAILVIEETLNLKQTQTPLDNFDMINPVEIKGYLSDNNDLMLMLLDADQTIKQIFGSDAKLILELRVEGETTDSKKLHVKIRATGDIDEKLDKLDLFDEQWLVYHLDHIRGRLYFNLDFS